MDRTEKSPSRRDFLCKMIALVPAVSIAFLRALFGLEDLYGASLFAQVLYLGRMGFPSGCLRASDSH